MPSEADFQRWYAEHAARLGLAPNPDDPRHFYDWRAAYRAGAKPDESGHWPSQFKQIGHPRLIIGGIDTRTGQAVPTKKELIKKLRHLSASGKMPRTGLSQYWQRRRKIEALKASRKAGAKVRAARGPTTTQAELEARKRATKPTTTKPTQSEIAAGRREGIMKNVPGYNALIEALTPKKEED